MNQPIQRYLDLYTNIDTINGSGFILSTFTIFSRTDLAGNILWTKPIPFSSDIISLKVTADSSILIAGNTFVNGFKNQVALSKLNSQGVLLWTKYFGSANANNNQTQIATSSSSSISLNTELSSSQASLTTQDESKVKELTDIKKQMEETKKDLDNVRHPPLQAVIYTNGMKQYNRRAWCRLVFALHSKIPSLTGLE